MPHPSDPPPPWPFSLGRDSLAAGLRAVRDSAALTVALAGADRILSAHGADVGGLLRHIDEVQPGLRARLAHVLKGPAR